MKKQTVLIAEEGRDIQELIESEFIKTNCFEVVARTGNGQEVVELAIKLKPDLIVLDLILPGRDGFTILEEIKYSKIDTKVIVLSALSHDMFISRAAQLGAWYYMLKPFDVATLVERAQMISESGSVRDVSKQAICEDFGSLLPKVRTQKLKALEEKITNIFITVGIPAHIKGYQFLREAIKMAVDNPDVINSITKKLYPSIADRFSTSSSKVERAIRHAIEVAWNRGKIENINSLFGVKVYGSSDKPTNGEFIALVADKMLLEGA